VRFGLGFGATFVLAAAGALLGAEPPPASALPPLLDDDGGWRVRFDPASSLLECSHRPTGPRRAGRLSFTALRDGAAAAWTIRPARDLAGRRLSLVDERGDAQAYVTVVGDPARLRLAVLPRPPQIYGGELRFTPDIALGPLAFACRTRLPERSDVVQMASGPADSLLNDSLFDPERDLVLRLGGRNAAISTRPAAAGRPVLFQAALTASPLGTEAASITLEVMPDYYRSRYVPEYRLIDRRRSPSAPTGWMSWNTYFDTAGEVENLEEARVGAQFLRPFGLEIWSIESWQDNSPRLPVSDFHNLTLRASPEKFPHGMKWLAERIRDLGFRPGIWTVPFGTGDEAFYREHREWFLHGADGKPMQNWCGRYVVDPSQLEVRRHMEQTHRTMSAEWGYEFFKIDGMSGRDPGYSAHFFERPEVRAAFRQPCADPYGLSIEALRRGIGPDRIFLACQGHYTGPEVAWADAARLGADIVHPNQPPHWENYLNQARMTLSQLFTNNLVWYNDPDTLLVGGPAPLDMVRIATTVVALPGQLTFFGDRLSRLPPERMRLLQQALPVCDVHPLDLGPVTELRPVWDLKVRRPFGAWDVVSLFNWGDRPLDLRLPFGDLGLDGEKAYLVHEFWSREFLGSRRGAVEARIEPRSNLLLAVHERRDRPQLISTDRHVSQGGVELLDESWSRERGELLCTLRLVAEDPLTAFIHVPAPFVFSRASAEDAAVERIAADRPPIVAVTLRRPLSGEARLLLTFGAGTGGAP